MRPCICFTVLFFSVIVPIVAPTVALASLADSLVASYPFNGDADDYSGHGNDGTINGAVLATGHTDIPNHAYYFDGVDDYITVPDSPSLDVSGPMSISFWVKLNSIPAGDAMPIGKSDYILSTNYLVRFHPGSILRWEYGGDCDATISPLETDTWYHVAVTAESASGNKQIFVNGELQTIVCGPLALSNPVNTPLTMGYASYGSEFLHGTLDDVRVWNRVLLPEEVALLFLVDDSFPVLHVSPDSLIFESQLYSDDPPPQTADIANIGGAFLPFATTESASWLNVQPDSGGPIPPNASLSIGINSTGVPAGIHQGRVIVTATGAMLSPDTLDVTLIVHDPRVGLMGENVVIRFAYDGSDFGDSIPCVIEPAPEYYTYEDGDVFKVETLVDIDDDIITAAHNVWYTGYGGGSVYGMYIWISGLNLTACGSIADVEVLDAEGAYLYELGPDYVILYVSGGCGGWGCGGLDTFLNHITVRLVAVQCGVCCDADGNCTLCTLEECIAPSVWHEDKIECVSGLCAVSNTSPPPIAVEGLQGAAPCPFGTRSTLSFTLLQRRRISLEIFDVAGRKVRSLQMGDYGPGTHKVDWDGKDAHGTPVGAGVYYARLIAGSRAWSKAIVVVR